MSCLLHNGQRHRAGEAVFVALQRSSPTISASLALSCAKSAQMCTELKSLPNMARVTAPGPLTSRCSGVDQR